MQCLHCGKEIPTKIKFCPHCGHKVEVTERSDLASKILLDRANGVAKHFVPAKLAAAFPSIKPLSFMGIYLAFLVIVASGIMLLGMLGGGLTGTYQTSDFFPVNQISFEKDGHFSAISYTGYTETYQGKYGKKLNGTYSLRFTGGSADGGSPVTQFEAASIGDQYELSVEKVNDQTLKVCVVPKINYWAWADTEAYFYRVV